MRERDEGQGEKEKAYLHIYIPASTWLTRLDLDKWIYEPPSESEEDTKDDNLSFLLPSGGGAMGGAGSGTFGNARYSPTSSPKGKKKRKKKSKHELEEEEEMKKVSHLVFYDWHHTSMYAYMYIAV